MRALVLVAFVSVGCAQSQDLSAHHAAPADAGGIVVADVAPPPAPDTAPLPTKACPETAPSDGDPCSDVVPWCRYELPDGYASQCTCGNSTGTAPGQWVCLMVADGPRRLANFVVANSSCSNGAPCAPGVRCTVQNPMAAIVKTCTCMGNGLLSCTVPTAR